MTPRTPETNTVRLAASALRGGGATTVHYRSVGQGRPPVLFLHGGWGYRTYPIDAAADALGSRHRVVIPDRSGHGRSTPVGELPPDFHRLAMLETVAFLDAMEIDRAVWWGHSDGAVIAAWAAIERPERVEGAILEGLHFFRDKPRSRAFFEQMARDPDAFGAAVGHDLFLDHGPRWREVLRLDGEAWLGLGAEAVEPNADLYDGRLREITCPVLLVHGGRDPRSEPDELDMIRAALPHARLDLHPQGGHSPHSQPRVAAAVAQAVQRFLAALGPDAPT
ncbi:MAG: hypothetical protein NVSMB12_19870 [Acidimicrobiales bacterium]